MFVGVGGGGGGLAYKSEKSKHFLLGHITLLTHIAISRTWTFTITHQIFSKYLKKNPPISGCFSASPRELACMRVCSPNVNATLCVYW